MGQRHYIDLNKPCQSRLCWLSQKHAEKQSCIQRLKASQIGLVPLVSLVFMTLQMRHGDLPNRVRASFTSVGNEADLIWWHEPREALRSGCHSLEKG
jgi:hypothetical protein